MKRLLFVSLCLSATAAVAAPPVLLETPVTYAPDATVVEQVRNECHIEDMLTRHVGDVLRKLNKGGDGTVASQADSSDARILRLQNTHVMGVGGGAWSGPTATTVSAICSRARRLSVTPGSIAAQWVVCGAGSREAVQSSIARLFSSQRISIGGCVTRRTRSEKKTRRRRLPRRQLRPSRKRWNNRASR